MPPARRTTRDHNKYKGWSFTINNWTVLPDGATIPDVEYLVYQQESGEARSTPHLQGYVRFTKPKRLATVKSYFLDRTIHLERANGTSKQNRVYCTKEETRVQGTEPYEYGECPAHEGPGTRADIHTLRDTIKAGANIIDLADNDCVLPALARYMSFTHTYLQATAKPIQRPNTTTRFCFGEAGTGKSTCAGVFNPDLGAHLYDNSLRGFWDGYVRQPVVIFDEMKGHTTTPTELNRILDRGPYKLNIKNSSVFLSAQDFRITSNYGPHKWWSEKVHWNKEALYRRIDEAHLHIKDEETEIFESENPKAYEDCAMLKLEARATELGLW